jgi:LPXTG-site transpeptidase (sortase) family protein
VRKRFVKLALALGSMVLLLAASAQGVGAQAGQVAGRAPAAIAIPAIGLRAPVVPVELDNDGAMAAPTDPDTVGWYDLGPGLDAPGNVLLDGHVDWGGRLRVFGRLRQLGPGDAVHLSDADGNTATYHVVSSDWYDADTTEVDPVFRQTTAQELTLITCGGQFDRATHQYLSRLVVRAVRAD